MSLVNWELLTLINDVFFQRAKLLKQKKEEGNALFKASDWNGAFKTYSEALSIDPCNKFTNAKLHYNRAVVGAKVMMS